MSKRSKNRVIKLVIAYIEHMNQFYESKSFDYQVNDRGIGTGPGMQITSDSWTESHVYGFGELASFLSSVPGCTWSIRVDKSGQHYIWI